MNRSSRWLVIVTIAIIIGVVFYYLHLNGPDNSQPADKTVVTDEVVKILNKDLEANYPQTAREVVQFFVRIQKCYYNEKYTEEELVKLAYKATELFDTELLTENPFDTYYEQLKDEINAYSAEGKTISQVLIDQHSDVVYSTVDEQKYAELNCTYYLKSDKQTAKVKETYILRKDENDNWKILGWKKYEESEWEK